MNKEVLILLLFLTLPLVQGASIYGQIYDQELHPVRGAVVIINSTPEQTMVANDASFTLDVPTGTYSITVKRLIEGRYLEQDRRNLTIDDEGDYHIDFILFPNIIEYEEPPLINPIEEDTPNNSTPLILSIGLIIILTGLIILIIKMRQVINNPRFKLEEDIDEAEVQAINIIKTQRRLTQKELREQLPYSEAKVSLLITDLEDQGRIKKIKKGRSNIIIFVK